MKPSLGRVVLYRGREGRLARRAAIVTATVDNLDPGGVEAGDVPALTDETHVHLFVFTPGPRTGSSLLGPGFGHRESEAAVPVDWIYLGAALLSAAPPEPGRPRRNRKKINDARRCARRNHRGKK